ncbi:Protein involved in sporulation [Streptomyces sp. YIM 130001]|nr:Protein involved in sporulation [Streptomyces sp. YIM 130001]
MRRRDLLKASGAAGAAISLASLAPPPSTGSRIGSDVPAYLRRRTARLRRLDNVLGGGDTYRAYLSEYQSTKALLRDRTYSDATGRALRSVLAEQGQQAGWAAFDAGKPADARGLYLESRQAALDADDAALAGNALAFLAYQQAHPKQAVETAAEACRTAGPDAPREVRALLHERLAWAHAVAGHATETEAALACATLALAEAPRTDTVDWAAWVDEDELDIMGGAAAGPSCAGPCAPFRYWRPFSTVSRTRTPGTRVCTCRGWPSPTSRRARWSTRPRSRGALWNCAVECRPSDRVNAWTTSLTCWPHTRRCQRSGTYWNKRRPRPFRLDHDLDRCPTGSMPVCHLGDRLRSALAWLRIDVRFFC